MTNNIKVDEAHEKEVETHVTHLIDTVEAQGFKVESRMSFACALGFHNWNGTNRCANCGTTRGR